ncbi:hypothetical protein ACFFK0_07085 [Paenibacillus chartarius]|uniref:Uncharacterized protein n=1 Tax=Paenibacillus chartarius TaxID=747481 RepID=A0ABV6DHV4_9BACL
MNSQKRFKGLLPLAVIMTAAASPVCYFVVNLMLGSVHLFNGIIIK